MAMQGAGRAPSLHRLPSTGPPLILILVLAAAAASGLSLRLPSEEEKKRDAASDLLPDFCATCHTNATCQQQDGKYICICNYGFVGNGRTYCQDKDECLIGTSKICGEHASCHNTHGSFYCVCREGYQASNNDRIFIPNDGTYCTVVDCGLPPSLPNANFTLVNQSTYGNKAVYTCQPGYVIESGNWTAVCSSRGQWEGSDLVCKEVNCGQPPLIPHSDKIWDKTTQLGSVVEYRCLKGFFATSMNRFSYCAQNGSWETLGLRCEVVDCGLPPSLPNANFTLVNQSTYGNKAVYTCQPGYVIESGNWTAVCSSRGQWEGSDLVCKAVHNWPYSDLQKPSRLEMKEGPPTPSLEINCGQPPLIPHSDRIWDKTSKLGSVVEYRCIKGFFATSMKRFSYCTQNGSWEILGLRCEEVHGFVDFAVKDSCLTWRRYISAGVNETYKVTIRMVGSKSEEIANEWKTNFTTVEEVVKMCLPLRMGTNYSMRISEESTRLVLQFSLRTPVTRKEAVFSNVSVFNDTCIKWHRESERTQSEEMFVFRIQGARWYQKEFHHEEILNFSTRSQTPELCLNLTPGSNYTVNISATNLDHSVLVHMTTPITDPQSPEVEFVSVQGFSPLFYLRKAEERNGPISSYQVIVVPWSVQCNFTCYSLPSLTYFSNGTYSDGYVTAQFPAKAIADNASVFTLGDRLYYGEFYNAPLQKGKDYCVILRTISEWNKVRTQSCVALAQIKDLSSSSPHMTTALLMSVAILCCILLLSLFATRAVVYVPPSVLARRTLSNEIGHLSPAAHFTQQSAASSSQMIQAVSLL